MFGAYLLISDFLVESLKAKKLAQNVTHFTLQFYSKNLTHFTQLTKYCENVLPQHSQKPYSLCRFYFIKSPLI